MQKACELEPSTMAAIIGLEDKVVEDICSEIANVVVPANYNCPGQLVISGSKAGIEDACARLTEAGAKRALVLPVGGAFHSPFMEPARVELEAAIQETAIAEPSCPIYQNVDAKPYTDTKTIKQNLIYQLTSPVKWTQTVQNMLKDGFDSFTEVGPGKVLQGLVKKVDRSVSVESAIV
jgi:[acyl-carrier-protein] S-malonyltransferase